MTEQFPQNPEKKEQENRNSQSSNIILYNLKKLLEQVSTQGNSHDKKSVIQGAIKLMGIYNQSINQATEAGIEIDEDEQNRIEQIFNEILQKANSDS
jgi:hypothetical protein